MRPRSWDKPRIALLIETSGAYGRGLLKGIASYARLHGPWSFYILPRAHDQTVPDIRVWHGTGIIARIESKAVAHAIAASDVPVIGLDLSPEVLAGLPTRLRQRISEIHPDAGSVARLAADHLLERAFASFAFVGIRNRVWSQMRESAFASHLARRGYRPSVYNLSEISRARRYGMEQLRLGAWLAKQPRPLGLMACNDDCGREVLDAALTVGLSVPDDVAVIGVDNDEILCELCDPPLSSVALNVEKGGYAAAEVLDGLMHGRRKGPIRLLVEATEVVSRRSTEVIAAQDRHIAQALQFIREHAREPIDVSDVLRQVPMSRRALEIRFRQVLRRSIHDEIVAARLRLAVHLLRTTDIKVEEVGERSGFCTASHMSVVFRKRIGLTPAAYRNRHRAPSA